jgi:hypothetical protein
MKLTIHSLFFLLVIIFCSSETVLSQSFTITQPVSKHQQFIVYVNDYFMDSITIQNNTNKELNLAAALIGSPLLQIREGTNFSVPPNATINALFQFWQAGSGCAGSYVGTLSITDANSSSTDQISVTGDIRSYAITDVSTGRQTICLEGVKVGQKACATVWAKNHYKQPLIISGFGFAYGNSDKTLSANPKGTLPIVLLPNEEAPIADICYSPTTVNSSEFEWLEVTRTPVDDPTSPTGTEVDISASSEIDTNLDKPCLVASVDTNLVGPILFGGSIDKVITLQNNRYKANTVSGVDFTFGDLKEFAIVGNPFPLTIDPLSSKKVTLRFSPSEADTIVKYRFAAGLQFNTSVDSTRDSSGIHVTPSTCGNSSLAFAGLAMLPTADSISTPLFPNKEFDLGMTGTAPSFSQDFHFDNNTTGKIKIVNVSMLNPGAEFAITNISPSNTLPFTLDVGGKMTVTVTFTPSIANKVFFNQVIITTDQGLISQTFPIQGMRQSVAKVSTLVNGTASLTINPNPTKDRVTITLSNAESSSIDIYDLLGNKHFTMKDANELTIDTRDLRLAPGLYFVRASGIEATGMPFTLTKKLIVN